MKDAVVVEMLGNTTVDSIRFAIVKLAMPCMPVGTALKIAARLAEKARGSEQRMERVLCEIERRATA
ncbi:MAG: hypothetical protein WB558_13590 [Terriglobales bacterium]